MRRFFVAVVLTAGWGVPTLSWGWGERGHHVICEAATRLVKEEGLRSFLQTKNHVLGHLCNVPDIYWRDLPESVTALGNPTHQIDADEAGLKIGDVPLDFTAFDRIAKAKGLRGAADVGSLWWRADQFVRLATEAAKRVPREKIPADKKSQQDPKSPYNLAVFETLTAMGLLGHFVGDVSMPYHNISDYDGRAVGHKGVHAFYETTCVNAMPLTLVNDVYSRALALKPVEGGTVLERMKRMSSVAFGEISVVQQADQILKPATAENLDPVRPSAEKALKKFRPLILNQMGRSARLLAALWDEIYVAAGRPNLQAYRWYRYPFTPEFIPPDYLPRR